MIQICPTTSALAESSANAFIWAANTALAERGEFIVALSGGSTPLLMYQYLALPSVRTAIDWSKVQVVWGDERCVPPEDPASNYRAACDTLLDHVAIPRGQIHRIHGEVAPALEAQRYEAVLRSVLRTTVGPPQPLPAQQLDLVILGLGEDGHTASLFPAERSAETEHWVVPSQAPVHPIDRVTLTPVVFNAAAQVLFLVTGSSKAAIVASVLDGPLQPDRLPAQRVAPSHGWVKWMLDSEAAGSLARGPQ